MMTNGDGTKLDGVGKRIRIGPPHFVPDRLIDTIEMGAVPECYKILLLPLLLPQRLLIFQPPTVVRPWEMCTVFGGEMNWPFSLLLPPRSPAQC